MAPYILINIIILIFGLFFEFINKKAIQSSLQKKLPNYFFIVPSFLIIFIFFAFRGDFTADYGSYARLFERYNLYNFREIFHVGLEQEFGYILFSRFIGVFTSNYLYLYAIVAFITLYGFYSQFNKYSTYIWLSVLMFVTVGPFYTSFNLIRQILAVAIIFSGSKFLYERKPIKFILVVLLASSVHQTALIMIPFYFILNWKIKFKNIILIIFGSTIIMLYFDSILAFVQTFFYGHYNETSYGMTGQGFVNAVLPIAFSIFTLFNYKKIDLSNTAHRIWVNALIYYTLFNILSLQVQLVDRVANYFSGYSLLLIPLIFSKMNPKELRPVYIMVFVVLLIAARYVILNGSEYDPYYFIWEAR